MSAHDNLRTLAELAGLLEPFKPNPWEVEIAIVVISDSSSSHLIRKPDDVHNDKMPF